MKVHIALLRATISIPETRSLKDKRRVVKSELTPSASGGTPSLTNRGGRVMSYFRQNTPSPLLLPS